MKRNFLVFSVSLLLGSLIVGVDSWANGPFGSGSGSSISGLTTNKLPKATSATAIGDSSLSDDGTTVTIPEYLSITNTLTTGNPVSLTTGASPPAAEGGVQVSIRSDVAALAEFVSSTTDATNIRLRNSSGGGRYHYFASTGSGHSQGAGKLYVGDIDGGTAGWISDPQAGLLQLGFSSAAPAGQTLKGSGGIGTDIAGGALTLAGGQGTGTGVGGSVILATAPAGSTGVALNALVTRWTVDSTGNLVGNGANAPSIQIGADPADAGSLRLANAEKILWEASPAGTDVGLWVGSDEALYSDAIAPAASGTRYVCIDTAGKLASSASACSGT